MATATRHRPFTNRISRGGVRHVLTYADQADKFDDIEGDYGRFVVGAAPAGWSAYRDADQIPRGQAFRPSTHSVERYTKRPPAA
jgi:acetyl-CoA synthetase